MQVIDARHWLVIECYDHVAFTQASCARRTAVAVAIFDSGHDYAGFLG